jgi:hypothetical protein
MAKPHSSRKKVGAAAKGVRTAPVSVDPPAEPASSECVVEHEEIARLAHSYWEARGCPAGSPEEDWHRAEQELRKPRQTELHAGSTALPEP